MAKVLDQGSIKQYRAPLIKKEAETRRERKQNLKEVEKKWKTL